MWAVLLSDLRWTNRYLRDRGAIFGRTGSFLDERNPSYDFFTYWFADSFDSTDSASYCMRGTSHDGTLRNDRKGIANPEIDLGSALTAHKLRTDVSVHVRTAVPHQSVSTRGKKSGHTH